MNFAFWNEPKESLFEKLGSSEKGLSAEEAERRLKTYGPNTFQRAKPITVFSLLIKQFANPLVLILIGAAIISLLFYQKTDAFIILSIVVLSGLLGFWQEKKAVRAIENLRKIVEVKAEVIREGISKEIAAEKVVPGDILFLNSGDLVPADCFILETKDLFVDEAVLTGESYPVEKHPGIVDKEAPLKERTNSLFMGTHIVSGTAKACAVRTAKETEFGQIATTLRTKHPVTDFQLGIRRFGYFLLEVTLILVLIIFALNVFFHRSLIDSFLFALAIAIGLTPQLLPAIISVNLAHGAKKMADKEVVVKQLISIENFGSMNVLCADKTGTLTEGITQLQKAIDGEENENEKVLFYAFLNARFQKGYSNPIDEALLKMEYATSGYERIDEMPYDFARKRITVCVHTPKKNLVISKGAFGPLFARCSKVETAKGDIFPISEKKQEIESTFEKLSKSGYRLIAVAYRETEETELSFNSEKDLTFLGFLILFDPPKTDVKDTIAQLKKLGIALKIVTGDNAHVARKISEEVGMKNAKLMLGKELFNLSNGALLKRVSETHVFAEVDPVQKEKIIETLRKRGRVVGYLGDGINDASALHKADVGISVNTALDVVKEEADIILLRKDLSVLLDGVKEGRKTFANTMKYILMATSANFGNMFSMAGASLFLSFLPLLPKQILLTNFLTDFPEMTISTDTIDPEMEKKSQRFHIKFIYRFMLVFGGISSLFDFATFGLLLWLGANVAEFRTGWFVESVISASLIVLLIRTRKPFFKSRPSNYLTFSVLAICLITFFLPYTPLGPILGFTKLPLLLIAAILGIVLGYMFTVEIAKKLFYKKIKM